MAWPYRAERKNNSQPPTLNRHSRCDCPCPTCDSVACSSLFEVFSLSDWPLAVPRRAWPLASSQHVHNQSQARCGQIGFHNQEHRAVAHVHALGLFSQFSWLWLQLRSSKRCPGAPLGGLQLRPRKYKKYNKKKNWEVDFGEVSQETHAIRLPRLHFGQ